MTESAPKERGSFASALIVAAIVLASRLPFLAPGYGTDPDAWRVAWASRVIAATGRYEAARFPGNPVQEFVSSLVGRGGPFALDGLTALFSALAAASFALALRRLGSRDAVLGGLALAATPAVYLASVQAMDYTWGLAFALAALVAALGGRPAATGILAGLAIGCRLTSAGWLVPLSLVLAQARPPGGRIRGVALCCALALAIGAAAFTPVSLTYGPGFFRFYQTGYPGPAILAKQATVDLWGVPGSIALGLAVVAGLLGSRRGPVERSIPARPNRWLVAAWTSGILIFVAAYLRLPIKAFYLVPVVPCALLLMAQLVPRRLFVVVCVALIASPWVLKVSQEGRLDAPAPTVGTVPLRLPGQALVIDLLRGPILTDHARRIERTGYVDRVLERARALGGDHVIVAWDWLPEIRVRIGGKEEGRVRYVYLMTRDELAALRRRGVGVAFLAGADGEVEHIHGYDPRAAGMSALEARPESQSRGR